MVYTFDDLGRTTAENWFATSSATSPVNTLTWTYEASTGRLTGSGDAGVAGDTYVYDSLGRIQTATRTLDGLSVPFTYVPSYSQRDERLGLNLFYGTVTTGPTPDPILYGQSAQFDALGQPTQLALAAYGGAPSQQANFSYDLAGQTTKIQRTQGSVVATESRLAYDNQGRLASLQHVQTGTGFTRQIARYDQAYDAVNRITRIDSSVDEASVYNYDKTGQLLTAQMTFENNEAYTYDANGNRTSGGTQSSGAHKNLVTQDAKYTYLYDGENNRIRRTERATGNYQLYTWDHRNRLTKVEFVNTSGVTVRAIEYRYDANDQKVAEFVDTTAPFDMANASAKWFIYDGGNVVLDFARADMSQAPGATISKRYFQGPGVDQLLAQENIVNNASQSVWWVLPDHLGSTRDLITASGSVIAHFQFDSFGNILDGRENVTRYQFTGREHDSHTDLNYHRARWYDPASGKWLSEDPIGFAAGDANVTRYVGNGVLNGTDPSGLMSLAEIRAGRLVYSCNCGWIDWEHAEAGNWSPKSIHNQVAIGYRESDVDPFTVKGKIVSEFTFTHNYWVRSRRKQKDSVYGVSLGIWRDLSVRFEKSQGTGFAGFWSNSSFSIEDLPSNEVAYYYSVFGYTRTQVEAVAGALDQVQSEWIFKELNGNSKDSILYVKNKTFRGILFDTCMIRLACAEQPRQWPIEFSLVLPSRASSFTWFPYR